MIRQQFIRRISMALTLLSMAIASDRANAQTRPAAPPAKPTQAAPVAPAAPSETPTRTEIITYDGWTVTCRDAPTPPAKRSCAGELKIVQNNNNVQNVVFVWLFGLKDGNLISVLQVPTGVQIGPGVDLKIGTKDVRKISYTICEPNRCEIAVPMDDTFVREAAAAATTDVTVYASDGRGVKFTVTMKGFDRAVAEVKK